jgi:hypothetical protein
MKAAACTLTVVLRVDTKFEVCIANLPAKRHLVHMKGQPNQPVAFEGGTVARLLFSDNSDSMGHLFWVLGECTFSKEDIADFRKMERTGGPQKGVVRWPEPEVAYTCPLCCSTHLPEKRGPCATIYVSTYQLLVHQLPVGNAVRMQQRLWCSPCFASLQQPTSQPIALYPDAVRTLGLRTQRPEVVP